MRKRRILFLTVIPSPYQRQLFDRLAKAQAFDVRVLYYAIGAQDRQWEHPELADFETVMAAVGSPQSRLRFVGRPAAAAPATGLLKRHVKEQALLVDEALNLAAA